jgi:hypothetical protein
MKIAGMQRLSQVDEHKIGLDLIKYSINHISQFCSHLYFLQIGDINEETLSHIESLGKPYKIVRTQVDYGRGWNFKNNESLDEMYRLIDDEQFDWVVYPDMDNLLPANMIELLEQADEIAAETVRLHIIECFGGVDEIIEVKPGFPIGPHFIAVKHAKDITFVGSDGFCEARKLDRKLVRHETPYCARHMRYVGASQIENRKSMNYFQEYFLQDHATIKYLENQKIDYYKR